MAPSVKFDNTKHAFAHYTDKQLRRAYLLFRMLNNPLLTRTGIAFTRFSLACRLPVASLLEPTIFRHFCGGKDLEGCRETAHQLAKFNIRTALDYAVEGKTYQADFERTTQELIRTAAESTDNPYISFTTLKVTAIAPFALLEKVSNQTTLTASERAAWESVQARMARIGAAVARYRLRLFIDAEESWVQPAIDRLATDLMAQVNTRQPLIYNTVQLYRIDRLEYLKASCREAGTQGYQPAFKLVRGAYMEKERSRAAKKDILSPIHPTKAATDKAYNEALAYCADLHPRVAFCAATHNEASCHMLTRLMEEKGKQPDEKGIDFCQLYGMGDHITYNLAAGGYNISKYVPYGPILEVIPYLMRRAQENTSVSGQMSRELKLLQRELKRRKQASR